MLESPRMDERGVLGIPRVMTDFLNATSELRQYLPEAGYGTGDSIFLDSSIGSSDFHVSDFESLSKVTGYISESHSPSDFNLVLSVPKGQIELADSHENVPRISSLHEMASSTPDLTSIAASLNLSVGSGTSPVDFRAEDFDPLICRIDPCKGTRFSSSGELRKHVKRKHTKPHICELCDYACGSPSDLVKHRRTHQEGHFFCPSADCNRSRGATPSRPFGRQDNLVDHMKRVHASMTLSLPASSDSEVVSNATARKRRKLDSTNDFAENEFLIRNRQLEDELRQRDLDLSRKDEEIKWLKQLVDKLAAGSKEA